MATEQAAQRKEYGACEERTIMLMGRTRTGKSTIAEVLATTLYKTKPLSIFSETREPIVKNFFTTDKNTQKSYRFTIIDTPGFFDMTRDKSIRLQNSAILEHIKTCLASNVRNVHLIGIVFNLSGGINEQDIDAMVYIKENFLDIAEITALVVTHCEHMNAAQREKLINDFFQHKLVIKHKLRELFLQGVLFMGSLRYESLEAKNEAAIYLEYNNILDMRTAFIEKCISCARIIPIQNSSCSLM